MECLAARWTDGLIVINDEDYQVARRMGFKAGDNLFYVPGVGGGDIPKVLQDTEGLPRAVMEAMAAGKPVVASNVRGNRDLVEHGRTGFLVFYLRFKYYFMVKWSNKRGGNGVKAEMVIIFQLSRI